jgi:hypothetical protein
VFAHAQTKVVAQQIGDKLDGKTLRATFAGKGYCSIELGDGRAGFTGGDLYAEPNPRLKLRRPGRTLHGARSPSEMVAPPLVLGLSAPSRPSPITVRCAWAVTQNQSHPSSTQPAP